jgi:hypothetical protein
MSRSLTESRSCRAGPPSPQCADALVRFSQALGRPVLHVAGGTVFAVVVEDTTYLLHGQSPELPPLRNVA